MSGRSLQRLGTWLAACALVAACGVERERCRVCEPLSFAFGAVPVGLSARNQFLWRNDGDTPIRLRMLRVPEEVAPPFGTDFACGRVCEEVEVPAHSTIQLAFTFTPTEDGEFQVRLPIGTSDGPDLFVNLTGVGEKLSFSCPEKIEFDVERTVATPVEVQVSCRNDGPHGALVRASVGSAFRVGEDEAWIPPTSPFSVALGMPEHDELGDVTDVLRLEVPGGLLLAEVEVAAHVVNQPNPVVDFGVEGDRCVDFGVVKVGSTGELRIGVYNPAGHQKYFHFAVSDPVFSVEGISLGALGSGEVPILFRPRIGGKPFEARLTASGVSRCLQGIGE